MHISFQKMSAMMAFEVVTQLEIAFKAEGAEEE